MWTSPVFYAAVLGLIGAVTALIRSELNRQTLKSHITARHSVTSREHQYGSTADNPLSGR